VKGVLQKLGHSGKLRGTKRRFTNKDLRRRSPRGDRRDNKREYSRVRRKKRPRRDKSDVLFTNKGTKGGRMEMRRHSTGEVRTTKKSGWGTFKPKWSVFKPKRKPKSEGKHSSGVLITNKGTKGGRMELQRRSPSKAKKSVAKRIAGTGRSHATRVSHLKEMQASLRRRRSARA